jgi:ribulose bisphosphate carboxylase small subunit
MKSFIKLFSMMLFVSILASQFQKSLAQHETEQGIPLSLNRDFFISFKHIHEPEPHKPYPDVWKEMVAGRSRILSTVEDLERFYPGEDAKFTQKFDLIKDVVVVVTTELLDNCRVGGVYGLERIREDHLKVTMLTKVRVPCKSEPSRENYRLIGFPIERPIATVEIVYIQKELKMPEAPQEK